jgi:hypothetical protein
LKKIKLYRRDGTIRAETLVDDEDYDRFGHLRWRMHHQGYVYRNYKIKGKWYSNLLHRLITGAPKGLVVDHINKDTLDNRKENLRVVTQLTNGQNSQRRPIKKPDCDRWEATVKVNYKNQYLGLYPTREEAQKVIDEFKAKIIKEQMREVTEEL